jgi:hypothetical protein
MNSRLGDHSQIRSTRFLRIRHECAPRTKSNIHPYTIFATRESLPLQMKRQ